MCCKNRGSLSRLAVLWGFLSLITLLVAFVSGSWLYTREPIVLTPSNITTAISFRIGLWRVCRSIKKVNNTMPMLSPACSLIKFSGWEKVRPRDLGAWAPLDLAGVFIARMRWCTILVGAALVLVVLAFFLALLGHCNGDNKSLVASGLFILGGLSLGTGLMVFATMLSATFIEATQYHWEPSSEPPIYDYYYGWCFFAAGAAIIMTKVAGVLTLTGYLNRFPSVDEMVREMVPGAERKLREHQRLTIDYLKPVHHRPPYNPTCSERAKYECECGPLLNKTPPDVCTTNKSVVDFAAAAAASDASSTILVPVNIEHSYGEGGCAGAASSALAGQTVPIQIKNHNSLAIGNAMACHKYGTIAYGGSASGGGGGVPYDHSRSRTLQPPRPRKKCVQVETFQTPETAPFADYSRRTHTFGYSGSAV